MGGLWVDYNLMTTIPGVFAIGEANFSDHGANRLGASALMQGLADGYFVIPYTIADFLAQVKPGLLPKDHSAFKDGMTWAAERVNRLLNVRGKRAPQEFHRELGHLLWNACGMGRNEAGLREAARKIPEIREAFWRDVSVPGVAQSCNQAIERAWRIADFLEFGELIIHDALNRAESCGCHLREESQTPGGEALRNDDDYCYVAAWEFNGVGGTPVLHKEWLSFESIALAQRSYA
jgi:succinate dehydrogenase / fumarate reductase flavoprotein subunit